MRRRREKAKVAAFSKIIIPAEFHSTDTQIQTHLNNLEAADSFTEQQSCLTAVSSCGIFSVFKKILVF